MCSNGLQGCSNERHSACVYNISARAASPNDHLKAPGQHSPLHIVCADALRRGELRIIVFDNMSDALLYRSLHDRAGDHDVLDADTHRLEDRNVPAGTDVLGHVPSRRPVGLVPGVVVQLAQFYKIRLRAARCDELPSFMLGVIYTSRYSETFR